MLSAYPRGAASEHHCAEPLHRASPRHLDEIFPSSRAPWDLEGFRSPEPSWEWGRCPVPLPSTSPHDVSHSFAQQLGLAFSCWILPPLAHSPTFRTLRMLCAYPHGNNSETPTRCPLR